MAAVEIGLPAAQCQWDADGVLRTSRFDDIYFSRDGAVAEKRHVFLNGCGLPEGWRDAAGFTIAELGFGTGLNFLLAWDAWRRTARPGARLHYVAVEGFPLSVEELREACGRWPELTEVAEALARAYGAPQRGFHRIHLREATLTLLFGEAASMLRALEADVDAWYLDGFSPDRNPDMWTPEAMAEIARLSHAGTRLSTYTVAGTVRRSLETAGFEVARAPGFGAKREMLQATFRGAATRPALAPWFARAPAVQTGHAAIVGAGIAGASVAHALVRRGWRVTLIDRQPAPAMETSGNPVGVLMPRLTADDSIEGRLHAAAWRYLLRLRETLDDDVHDACGVLQLAEDAEDIVRLQTIAARAALPADYLKLLDAREASERAGVTLAQPALYFPQGGIVRPRAFCAALVKDAAFLQADVAAAREAADGVDIVARDGSVCARADVAIFANALAARDIFPWLTARRGQITAVPARAAKSHLRAVIAASATVTPAVDGHHYVGATFDWTKDTDAAQPLRAQDHARNLASLAATVPDLFAGVETRDLAIDPLGGRAALRCMTPDHLPVAGPVPDQECYRRDYAHLHHGQHWSRYPRASYMPRTFVLTGLAARGFVTAPLAAEMLACHIADEPWPLERDLACALHPARFLVRELQRRRG